MHLCPVFMRRLMYSKRRAAAGTNYVAFSCRNIVTNKCFLVNPFTGVDYVPHRDRKWKTLPLFRPFFSTCGEKNVGWCKDITSKRNPHTGATKQNEVAHKMYAQPLRGYLVSCIVDYFSSSALLICFSFCFISKKQIKQTTV